MREGLELSRSFQLRPVLVVLIGTLCAAVLGSVIAVVQGNALDRQFQGANPDAYLSKEELLKSCEIAVHDLWRARRALSHIPEDSDREFRDCLFRRGPGNALAVLEEIGRDQGGSTEFWTALADAAEHVQLPARAAKLRAIPKNLISD